MEFKALPSGVHSVRSDVVSFMHEGLTGLAVFRQNGVGMAQVDRSLVKMYSLGVLCKGPLDRVWPVKDVLNMALGQLIAGSLKKEELDVHLGELWTKLQNHEAKLMSVDLHDEFKSMFEDLGPLTFTLWKLVLLGKRVVIYMESGECDHERLAKYVFCLSTAARKGIEVGSATSAPSPPLYNVCITDIGELEMLQAFVSSTSDQIILEKPQLYDYALRLSAGETRMPVLHDNKRSTVYSTGRDLTHFGILYEHIWGHAPSLDYAELATGKSLAEMAWYVLGWWASAGDSIAQERTLELPLAPNEGLETYFSRLNKKTMSEISEMEGTVTPQELYEAGFEPGSALDLEFIVELARRRFGHAVSIASYMDCLC